MTAANPGAGKLNRKLDALAATRGSRKPWVNAQRTPRSANRGNTPDSAWKFLWRTYGYLIGFRHDNASLRETKKQEAFFHAGMAKAYKRVSISIDKMLQNHEKIDQS